MAYTPFYCQKKVNTPYLMKAKLLKKGSPHKSRNEKVNDRADLAENKLTKVEEEL